MGRYLLHRSLRPHLERHCRLGKLELVGQVPCLATSAAAMAYAWGLFEDVAQPGRYLEYFLVASWLEHLRQHERVTRADQDIQTRALSFHTGPDQPLVSHFTS